MKEEKVISKSQGTASEDNIIEFPITNDIVFNLVMQDPEISRQLLERIFPDKKIGEIRLINEDDEDVMPVADKNKLFDITTQYVIENGISAKGIRLDVFMIDDNEWYDIEMQCGYDIDLPKRSRYYHSAVDVAMLHKGEGYNHLKPSYVIFICTFDLFGEDMPVYQFEMLCKNKTDLKLGDETCTIILNATCTRKTEHSGEEEGFAYVRR
ncbi:Rpn family recombination-promoting nuclease/putative transposase [Aminicella lysinilytica]|uniref:Putative transposase/invertase (TIGR01784 family) n=1 Tax=Aminicella lysinilytica TaxID=433323 RepID=A0A4V3CRX6_9FIRM|nr:Rpn family recombination-promoting nuclease/putative transposase [Aminicella lysinilytica]TDP58462.1 putative transposase/invertase (TIGR01784 family) [Aminicella lysinilytica]